MTPIKLRISRAFLAAFLGGAALVIKNPRSFDNWSAAIGIIAGALSSRAVKPESGSRSMDTPEETPVPIGGK